MDINDVITIKETKGRGKQKTEVVHNYIRLTLEDMKSLKVGDSVPFLTRQDQVKEVKVTSVKTWKTRKDIRLGLKYGLYEYSYARAKVDGEDIRYSGEILLKEIENV
jgi:hypothetical protein